MATKTSGSSLDKRCKYDKDFKAEALRLASESRRTQAAAQQAQLMAEVSIEEVARDPDCAPLIGGWRRNSIF